jgi:hypothetical protein
MKIKTEISRSTTFLTNRYFAAGFAAATVVGIALLWTDRVGEASSAPSAVPYEMLRTLDSLGLGRTLGAAASGVRIVEMFDYECAACALAHEALWPILQRRINEGNVVYSAYEVPLPRHSSAAAAGVVAHCIARNDSDSYWRYRHELFTRQANWVNAHPIEDHLLRVAATIGADTTNARACAADRIDSARRSRRAGWAAVSESGLSYTPVWSINGRILPWREIGKELAAIP